MLENPSYKIKVYDQRKFAKVVAFGSPGSGKTALMESIDRTFRTLPNMRSKFSTAGTFDLVIVNHENGCAHIYGTKGNERFNKVNGIVSVGLNIGLIVVDSTRSMTDFEKSMLEELKTRKIPYLLVANKMDLPAASVENVRKDAGSDCYILPISAKYGTGVDLLMSEIFRMIGRFDTVYHDSPEEAQSSN